MIYREDEDGAFLFDPETGNLRYMNRTAKEIFVLLNGQTDMSLVVQHLLGLYPDMDQQHVIDDLAYFLHQLEEHGFIISSAGTK